MALCESFRFIFDFSDCTDYKIKSSILIICVHSLGKTFYSLALFPFCTDIPESNNNYELLSLIFFLLGKLGIAQEKLVNLA